MHTIITQIVCSSNCLKVCFYLKLYCRVTKFKSFNWLLSYIHKSTVDWNRFWGWRHRDLYIIKVQKAFPPGVVYIRQCFDWSCDHLYTVHGPKKSVFTQKGNYHKCHEFSKYMYPWAHKISKINEKLWTGAPKITPHDHIIKFGKQEAFQTCI